MTFLTLRAEGVAGAAQRDALDAMARSHGGGAISWRTSDRIGRSYGLCEAPGRDALAAELAAGGATVYETPIIALAVFPAVPEALPPLLDALAGPGRPAELLACEPCDGGIVIEWDLEKTPASVALRLVDVELARFNSGRAAELLTPLPPAWVARLAADGLQAPEIAPDRILETLIERAGLRV